MGGNYKARIPRQERGIETKKRIMEAAVKLFSDKGYHKTSSNEISELAGVPIGSFYAYFKDKKSIFLEAVSDYNKQVCSMIEQDVDFPPAIINKEYLHDLINNLVEAHRILPNFHREIEAMRLYDPGLNKLMTDQKNDDRKLMRNLLENFKNNINTDNLEAASLIIGGAVENIVHEVAFSEGKIDGEQYINELVSMLTKYLL
jgi:AcrR family transcriptional regulator